MSRIYPTYADHINKARYLTYVPAYYDPATIKHILGDPVPDNTKVTTQIGSSSNLRIKVTERHYNPFLHVPAPIYEDQMVQANLSIMHFIDMFISQTPFEICDKKQFLEVFHVLDAFLLEIEPKIIARRPEYIDSANKVVTFRQGIVHNALSIINSNPAWLKIYRDGGDKVTELFNDIFSFVGGPQEEDPLEELRHPPIQVPTMEILRKEAERKRRIEEGEQPDGLTTPVDGERRQTEPADPSKPSSMYGTADNKSQREMVPPPVRRAAFNNGVSYAQYSTRRRY